MRNGRWRKHQRRIMAAVMIMWLAAAFLWTAGGSFAVAAQTGPVLVDIQVRLTEPPREDQETGQVLPGEVEAVLLVRDQDYGISSIFYSVEADGQAWNYRVSIREPGENETCPDPAAGYDHVESGSFEEWNILEAEGDKIISMSRPVYVYARDQVIIRLAFTDQVGNVYSYQENCPVPFLPQDQQDIQEELPPEQGMEEQGEDHETIQDDREGTAEEYPEQEPEPVQDAVSAQEEIVEGESPDPQEVSQSGSSQPDIEGEGTAVTGAEIFEEEGAETDGMIPGDPAPVPENPEDISSETEEMPGEATEDPEGTETENGEENGEPAGEETAAAADDGTGDEGSVEEEPETVSDQEEDAVMPEPAQTWSSYTATPQYYYPQTSYGGGYRGTYSSGTSGYTSGLRPKEDLSAEEEKDPETGQDKKEEQTSGNRSGSPSTQKKEDSADPDKAQKDHDGSTYDLSSVQSLIGQYHQDLEDLVIYEENSQRILPESIQVMISRNGEMMELERDADYTFRLTSSTGDKKTYKYIIGRDNFSEEGTYRVFLISEDAAGNQNSSEAKDAPIWFHIDHTEPLILSVDASGDQELKGVREVRVRDNLQLSGIDIYLGDKKVEYEQDGEVCRFQVPPDAAETDVRVVARDKAGNTYERVLTNYVQNGKARVRAGISPVPLIMLAAAALGGVFLFRRRRRSRRAGSSR